MNKMLILRGIRGHYDGKDWPRGALYEAPTLEYARRMGFEGKVLDVSGETGPHSAQTTAALAEFRKDSDITALYGFSGGGYNVRHILNALTKDEKKRIQWVVVIGAPAVGGMDEDEWQDMFKGNWMLVYRTNPPEGHMYGPQALLNEHPLDIRPNIEE